MNHVFITGASTGIGQGLARKYARPGATLGLVARRAALLDELATELRQAGATVHVFPADVADTARMTTIARDFVERAGRIDLVVANAGVGISSTTMKGESEPIAALMRINVIGVTNTVVPFIPRMLEQKSGVLVAVSSMAGHRALPGRAAYSSSKAAVITFMDGLRMELHGTGVHAMTICPGFVKTPMTDVLDHPMPFLVDVDAAVASMTHAIDERARTFSFPWQMALLRHVMVRAPEWLLRRAAPAPRRVGTI